MARRWTALCLCLLSVGAVGACLELLPWIWDGSYQIAASLEGGAPFVYKWRFHTAVLWWPAVWLARWTEDREILSLAFGLPFLMAPAVALAVASWFARASRPGLAMWAAVGTGIAIPGQVFVINDSVWQQTLAWPLVIGAMVPLAWPQRIAWVGLALAQGCHQVGVLALAMAAAAAAGLGRSWQRNVAIAFFVAALAKAALSMLPVVPSAFDAWAVEEASVNRLWQSYLNGLNGKPLAALAFLFVAALAAVASPRRGTVLACAVAASGFAVCLVLWAANPAEWLYALDYRRWVMPAAVPFMLLAWYDARTPPAPERQTAHAVLAVTVAATFSAVLLIQSAQWSGHLATARSIAAPLNGGIPASAFLPLRQTPLEHWSLPSVVMLQEGRNPGRYLIVPEVKQGVGLAPWHPLQVDDGDSYFRIAKRESPGAPELAE
jgi:hypothetical protein